MLAYPTLAAVVPAADSASSIWPCAQEAMFGMIAMTTATACRAGTAWKAWAPMSSPMYSRIGTIAGFGSTAPSSENRPQKHSTAMTTPLPIEYDGRPAADFQPGRPLETPGGDG